MPRSGGLGDVPGVHHVIGDTLLRRFSGVGMAMAMVVQLLFITGGLWVLVSWHAFASFGFFPGVSQDRLKNGA